MRKTLSLSALLSSLLACPLYAAPPAPLARPQGNSNERPLILPAPQADVFEEAVPAVDAAVFEEFSRQALAGRPLSAYGMQALGAKLAYDAQDRLRRRQMQRDTIFIAGPTPEEARFVQNLRAVQPQKEKAAYVGVSTTPVDATLADQLALPRGMGLIVEFVDKDSPAEKAGFKLHDVIQKLEDQWLVNAQQFAVLVRSKKPGESVNFTVIRAGKPVTLTATLAEKEMPVLQSMPAPMLPPGMFGGANDVLPDHLAVRDVMIAPRGNAVAFHVENTQGSTKRTLIDDQHDLTLTTEGEKTELLAKDRAGNVLYKGPADVASLPADLKAKVESLKNSTNAVTLGVGGQRVEADSFSINLGRTDDEHTIALRIDKTGRAATIKDRAGNLLYDGPVNSEDDLKKLPDPLQAKVKMLLTKAHVDEKVELKPGQPSLK